MVCLCLISPALGQEYPWLQHYDNTNTIKARFDVPEKYKRIPAEEGSFAQWLRHLPLKEDGAKVLLYNGDKKWNQWAHCAVVNIDVGNKDLQQCADAVIRLRAEYLYSRGMFDSISFNFTSGDRATFRDWISGKRPRVNGNKVTWTRNAAVDSSYATFREYLNTVFTYAGSFSLSKELKRRTDPCDIQIGDIFIQGGFPGHAVIVVDLAEDKSSGKRMFMLAQSYMPAQEIHVLKNPYNATLSPWYDCDFGERIRTPEWTFERADLKRW
ncbi:MAG: DUF4846 domain-containing protein [Candidatus Zixiibacteriota bacterium]|nr:MAG: DUF4846 domain-containing protein [candidate division Zixibacteria bacterium]